MPIQFFSEDISYTLDNNSYFSEWIELVIKTFHKTTGEINYIFCSDNYLLDINREHLNHDYFTDIITFDNSEDDATIDADIFISIDRVRENAQENHVEFSNELSRVMAHGVLHLIGFSDKSEEEKTVMREKEEACISLQKK